MASRVISRRASESLSFTLAHARSGAQRPCRLQIPGCAKQCTSANCPSIAVTMSKSVIFAGNLASRRPPFTPRSVATNPARRSGTAIRLMNFSEILCEAAISFMVRGESVPETARSKSTRRAYRDLAVIFIDQYSIFCPCQSVKTTVLHTSDTILIRSSMSTGKVFFRRFPIRSAGGYVPYFSQINDFDRR